MRGKVYGKTLEGGEKLVFGLAEGAPEADEAACLGVWLHATAGDLAARQMGQEAMLARDITVHLGEAWSELHECLQTR